MEKLTPKNTITYIKKNSLDRLDFKMETKEESVSLKIESRSYLIWTGDKSVMLKKIQRNNGWRLPKPGDEDITYKKFIQTSTSRHHNHNAENWKQKLWKHLLEKHI